MKEIKVINNFLPKKDFKKISSLILGQEFPWYWSEQSTIEKTKHKKDQFLCHSIKHQEYINSQFTGAIMEPIKNKLKYNYLLRAKVNLNFNQAKHIKTNYHVDVIDLVNSDTVFNTAIYYINTNNGYTEFEGIGDKIHSKENTLVIFPGDVYHRGVTQTDESRRVLININYI